MGEKEHTLWAQLQLSFFPLRDGKVHILDVASLYAPAMLSPSTSSLLGIFFPYVKWRRMHFLKLLPLLALFPVFRISLPPRFIFFVSILISDSLLWSSSFLFPSFILHILAFVLFFLLSAWGPSIWAPGLICSLTDHARAYQWQTTKFCSSNMFTAVHSFTWIETRAASGSLLSIKDSSKCSLE